MKKIHKLPSHIISRIAAGEVIERPVYVVKELVENSIDAGATEIFIDIENAGLSHIIIRDNGEGMSKEDLMESIKPHTTSKTLDDTLSSIRTLGFRGEALSSIASVSQLSLASRPIDKDYGYIIDSTDNKIPTQIGMPVGTQVTVLNLFSTIPARKKFLKSLRTEFRHIVDLITHYALSHTDIHFLLIHNKKVLFDIPSTSDNLHRTHTLLGNRIFQHLLPITYQDEYITISGFISKPQITTSTLDKHYLFVNKRKVSDKLISQSVKDAYGNLLENTAYPIVVLFIDLPYEMVDVNVHPRKEHIAFINSTDISNAVTKAVSKTLLDHNLTFHNIGWKDDLLSSEKGKRGNMESYASQLLKQTVVPWSNREKNNSSIENVFQINKTYLIAESIHVLFIVDQHAAHERILYEQYEKEYIDQKKIKNTASLPKGVLLDLTASDSLILHENIGIFTNLGFVIEEFGNNKFVISIVPKLFLGRAIDKIIQEMIDDLREERVRDIDMKAKRMLSYLACRSAIMAGDEMSSEEARKLIEKLRACTFPFTCPHGRPTMIEIDNQKLNKMFRRE